MPTNRVIDGHQTETAEWVKILLMYSWEDMKSKKDREKSSLKSQSNSILIDTSQLEPTKTSESINQSQNNNSKTKSQESEDIDLCYVLFFNSPFSLSKGLYAFDMCIHWLHYRTQWKLIKYFSNLTFDSIITILKYINSFDSRVYQGNKSKKLSK